MVVRIRLARFGRRHESFYNIVVAQARSARNSKPLEVIGMFNPKPYKPASLTEVEEGSRPVKAVGLDISRTKYWLGVGAQPSEPVWKLLRMGGLVEKKE